MLKNAILITAWLIVAVALGQMQGMEDVSCAWLCMASFYVGMQAEKHKDYQEEEEDNA